MKILSENFYEIAKMINNHRGRLYLVGGAVRDLQLGKIPHDVDFCVVGLSAEEFSILFKTPRIQGKNFPVFVINGCEFALARKEKKVGIKHTDFEIFSDKSITIEEDLARRDLTINSMAIDVLTSEIIDPYDGIIDMQNKILRMTSKAYSEDPLRVYRTARFAATLDFKVEDETLKTMISMRNELPNLSAERVFTEFRKALNSKNPSLFFETLRQANVLDIHFKELSNLIGVEQPERYHPEGDAYIHTIQVLNRVTQSTNNVFKYYPKVINSDSKITIKNYIIKKCKFTKKIIANDLLVRQKELIRFGALVHDFGKGVTPKVEWPHHYNHETNGIQEIKRLCNNLKMPKLYEKAGVLISLVHMKAGMYNSLKPSTKVKLFMDIETSRSIGYEGVEIIASSDSKKPIHFAKVARQVMKIGVTTTIKEKCTSSDGEFDYQKAKNMVLQNRITKLGLLE